MSRVIIVSMAQLENFRLKVFRAVAEHLSFRKAAEHLFLTQPAVTLQIKALEEDLGASSTVQGQRFLLLSRVQSCWAMRAMLRISFPRQNGRSAVRMTLLPVIS